MFSGKSLMSSSHFHTTAMSSRLKTSKNICIFSGGMWEDLREEPKDTSMAPPVAFNTVGKGLLYNITKSSNLKIFLLLSFPTPHLVHEVLKVSRQFPRWPELKSSDLDDVGEILPGPVCEGVAAG